MPVGKYDGAAGIYDYEGTRKLKRCSHQDSILFDLEVTRGPLTPAPSIMHQSSKCSGEVGWVHILELRIWSKRLSVGWRQGQGQETDFSPMLCPSMCYSAHLSFASKMKINILLKTANHLRHLVPLLRV